MLFMANPPGPGLNYARKPKFANTFLKLEKGGINTLKDKRAVSVSQIKLNSKSPSVSSSFSQETLKQSNPNLAEISLSEVR